MRKRIILSAAVVVLLAAAGVPAINWAQDAAPSPDPKAIRDQEKVMRKQAEAMHKQAVTAEIAARHAAEAAHVKIHKLFTGTGGHPRHLMEIHEAAVQLRDAADESAKAAAMKQLTEVVDKYFEEDMRVREQELANIEARLNKLRAQLDRRRVKKEEIVDLQVKVAINEADGLGFYSEPKPGMFEFRTIQNSGTIQYAPAAAAGAVPPPPPAVQ